MGKVTTIRVQNSTKLRLGKYGTTNDTYDDVLNRLMDLVEAYDYKSPQKPKEGHS